MTDVILDGEPGSGLQIGVMDSRALTMSSLVSNPTLSCMTTVFFSSIFEFFECSTCLSVLSCLSI